jgi:hypothetical protein
MTDYVLIYSGGSMPETEAEQAAVMQQWTAWYGELGDAVVDGGNPFTPLAKTIASDGTVSDVPGDYMASGYSIIKAETLDEAVELAKGCPIARAGGQISVFETFKAM